MTFLNKVATELFSASYEFRYKCIPRGHTLCQLWQLTLILQHLSWHRKPTVIKGDVSNFFPQTVSDPLLLIHFDTYCNMVAASIQTCKESRQGVKHKIVPAETHQLILCRSNRFTQIHTDTHTHHSEVSPPGRSAGPQLVLSGSISSTRRVRMQPFQRP